MPLNLPDFLRAHIQKSEYTPLQKTNPFQGLENLIPNAISAYHAPQKLKEDRETAERKKKAEEMAQRFMETYGPREREADLSLKENMAKNYGRLASGMGAGSGSGLGSGTSGSSRNSALTPSLRQWNSLPSNVKSDVIAQGVGMGYSPDEVAIAISSGKTLKDLADSAGVDLKNVQKQFSPTTANITKQKEQEGRGAELDFLETKVSEATTPYARRVFGYSPKEVWEGLSGTNSDERAKFLAGRALQPELAGARSSIANGSNAHEALREVKDAALGNFKIYESTVGPEVYKKTQHYINEWLKEGLKARGKSIYNQSNHVPLFDPGLDDSSGMSNEELLNILGGG